MNANELRRRYIDFFVKKYNHKEIKGSSLLPENDPTVLFTTAGMHPLVPFLMGETHPLGKRLVNVQKCLRTDDIDEVGDECHLTFFEMLGNWSLGDYFKELAIKMSYEFLTSSLAEGGLELDKSRLAVSCFAGDKDAPRDDEAADVWRKLGFSDERIAFLPKKNNWWGPAGQTGPCGPDTEMFFWTGETKAPDKFNPDDGKWVEIWNDVFMQYFKTSNGKYEILKQQNVDTGMGFERVLSIMNNLKSPFETELFKPAMDIINTLKTEKNIVYERIIADHLRAAVFVLGDENGVVPSNTDQGYILRRLIRRAIRYGKKLGIEGKFAVKIAEKYVQIYQFDYPELEDNKEKIYKELDLEEERFQKTLIKGENLLKKEEEKILFSPEIKKNPQLFPENFFFEMFATYGFPLELTIEELVLDGWIKDDFDKKYVTEKFNKFFEEHQKLSKAGAEKKFAGGLADHSEEVTKLHTATHLLDAALRIVLGEHVFQKGANITAERLRFDFSHPNKMTPEEIKKVEDLVNEQIKKGLDVTFDEMSVDEAKKLGAIGVFESKYGEKVKVYTIKDKKGNVFSREICGGPHVKNTSALGGFKIIKEESSSSGVRRIKAVIGV